MPPRVVLSKSSQLGQPTTPRPALPESPLLARPAATQSVQSEARTIPLPLLVLEQESGAQAKSSSSSSGHPVGQHRHGPDGSESVAGARAVDPINVDAILGADGTPSHARSEPEQELPSGTHTTRAVPLEEDRHALPPRPLLMLIDEARRLLLKLASSVAVVASDLS